MTRKKNSSSAKGEERHPSEALPPKILPPKIKETPGSLPRKRELDDSIIERDPDYKTFRIIAEREAELAELPWEQQLADDIIIGGSLASKWIEDIQYGFDKCLNEDGLNFPDNFKRLVQALFKKNCSMEVKRNIFEKTDCYLKDLAFEDFEPRFEDDKDPRYKIRDTARADLIRQWKIACKSAEAQDATTPPESKGSKRTKPRFPKEGGPLNSWQKIADHLGVCRSTIIKYYKLHPVGCPIKHQSGKSPVVWPSAFKELEAWWDKRPQPRKPAPPRQKSNS